MAGLYEIVNLRNGKKYVGSTNGKIKYRMRNHEKALRDGTHVNPKLQYAWNKYGADAFVFRRTVECHPDFALFFEQRLLDYWRDKDWDSLYNVAFNAWAPQIGRPSPNAGKKASPELLAKLSVASKAMWARPGYRERHARAMKSEEFKRRASDAHRGQVISAEARRKMSAAHKARGTRPPSAKGRKLSESTKAKLAENVRRRQAARREAETSGNLPLPL